MLACLLGLQSQHLAAFEVGGPNLGCPVGFVWVKEQVGAEILLSCCEAHRPRGNSAFLLTDKGAIRQMSWAPNGELFPTHQTRCAVWGWACP